jgi:RecA-family ATPase
MKPIKKLKIKAIGKSGLLQKLQNLHNLPDHSTPLKDETTSSQPQPDEVIKLIADDKQKLDIVRMRRKIAREIKPIEIVKPLPEVENLPSLDLSKEEFTLEELLTIKETEIPFLVEKLIPKEAIVFLAGASEVGKSLFYSQLALSIINGDTEFLGLKLNTFFRRVLMFSTEDGPVSISTRSRKQLTSLSFSSDVTKRLDIITSSEKVVERIQKFLDMNQYDLVIIDAFGDVFDGEINVSNSVRLFLNKFSAIIRQHRTTFLIVHHIGKGKESKQANKVHLLGSVGIEGKARNVVTISKNPNNTNYRILSIVKGNYISDDHKKTPIILKFDQPTLTYSIADDSEYRRFAINQPGALPRKKGKPRDEVKYQSFLKMHKERISQKEIAATLKLDKSTVCRWVKEYRNTHGYDTTSVGPVP